MTCVHNKEEHRQMIMWGHKKYALEHAQVMGETTIRRTRLVWPTCPYGGMIELINEVSPDKKELIFTWRCFRCS